MSSQQTATSILVDIRNRNSVPLFRIEDSKLFSKPIEESPVVVLVVPKSSWHSSKSPRIPNELRKQVLYRFVQKVSIIILEKSCSKILCNIFVHYVVPILLSQNAFLFTKPFKVLAMMCYRIPVPVWHRLKLPYFPLKL